MRQRRERLHIFNGLLLAPQPDALFDGAWMTSEETGGAFVSPLLPAHARGRLAVKRKWRIAGLTARHQNYLAFHSQHRYRTG